MTLKKELSQELKKIWGAWNHFWFEADALARISLFRFGLGLLLFFAYAIRSYDLNIYFSSDGIMPLSSAVDLMPMHFRPSLFFYFTSKTFLWACNALFLASLAALALGWFARPAAIIAFILQVSFLHRNMAPTYGVDMIGTFYLLYFCFTSSGPKRPDRESVRGLLDSAAFRLMQLQLCIIYGYSGLDKVKGPQWWGGEALWGVVSNPQLARFDFSLFAHAPLLLVFMTYTTLFWEIYFPFLVWVPALRKYMLFFGVALHVGIGVMVNIPFFGALMILIYILFLEEETAARILKRLRDVPGLRSALALRH